MILIINTMNNESQNDYNPVENTEDLASNTSVETLGTSTENPIESYKTEKKHLNLLMLLFGLAVVILLFCICWNLRGNQKQVVVQKKTTFTVRDASSLLVGSVIKPEKEDDSLFYGVAEVSELEPEIIIEAPVEIVIPDQELIVEPEPVLAAPMPEDDFEAFVEDIMEPAPVVEDAPVVEMLPSTGMNIMQYVKDLFFPETNIITTSTYSSDSTGSSPRK